MPVAFYKHAVLLGMVLSLVCAPAMAADGPSEAQVAWRLLDYIAVDYAGAVQGGRVVSDTEYAEMKEFAASARTRLASLPPHPGKAELVREADILSSEIAEKATPQAVAVRAQRLAAGVLVVYPTPLAPSQAPDLRRGATLYAEQCGACHGATGSGDGPNAKTLDPPPIAFTDRERAQQRSLFGLYQVIGQGLEGTSMPSFAHLSSEERWALAFYVGGFAYRGSLEETGARLWNQEPPMTAAVPDLKTLSQQSPAVLAQRLGVERAAALTAYLRHNPEVLAPKPAGRLDNARAKLSQSLAAYGRGDREAAEDLALAAYLDGFEPLEPTLRARDGALVDRIEGAMAELRASLSRSEPVNAVDSRITHLETLFDTAELALAPERANATSSFVGAFAILLREGLEALLLVVAIIAFLRKAERQDVLGYVHAGWVSALLAGGLTWVAATYLISISGAGRELIEGFGSLVAAIVLVSVGVWMHGKSQADAWQRYIKEQLSAALARRSGRFLFLLAFVVVYREVFETILFYAALWGQGGRAAMLAGAGVAIVVLAIAAKLLLSYSRRLPIAQFFSYSSLLMAVLAIVLAGKGVAGLQEAGLLGVSPLARLPRFELLGIFPTWEGLGAQLGTFAVIVLAFRTARRKSAPLRAGSRSP